MRALLLSLAPLVALSACKESPKREPPTPTSGAAPTASAARSSTAAPIASAAPSALPEEDAGGCAEDMIVLADGCIDRHEVTVADYVACAQDVAEKRCPAPETTIAREGASDDEHALFDPLCNARDPAGRGEHPMNCVDLAAAEAFCRAHGKRLPTGEEWERAARGVAGGKYPWGASSPVSSLVNACGAECVAWKKAHKELVAKIKGLVVTAEAFPGDDPFATTAPIGSFAMGASQAGALDMAGNVEEWTQAGELRGGSWLSTRDAELRADARRKVEPTTRSATAGFRCAR